VHEASTRLPVELYHSPLEGVVEAEPDGEG